MRPRPHELGLQIGVLPPGPWNAITDVAGVRVGHLTKIEGPSIRTGATAIVPHDANLFHEKVPAGLFVANGFGKLAGATQLDELGTLETPILLTNTLSVASAIDAAIDYTLAQPGNENLRSVNAVVGETNDSLLNDIRARLLRPADFRAAIDRAQPGRVDEGNVGAGTGTVCFGFKGGIGTASRVLPPSLGGHTVGVLAQTNFGGVLQIDSVPIGKELRRFSFDDHLLADVDGSCMLIVATDAPLCPRNLRRLAARAFMGLARTGGIASNGSGDYALAFSTSPQLRIPHDAPPDRLNRLHVLHDHHLSPLFLAAIEAAEESIIASLFAAETMTGHQDRRVEALDLDRVIPILKAYKRVKT